MAGIRTAINLRELQERISICPLECLFHHFCETVIRPTFDDPEFRNDFAVWAARSLRDRVLAERLGIINPYEFDSFEQLREQVIDIVEERMSEAHSILWAPPGQEFQFMRAVTVVFDTGISLNAPEDLATQLPHMSLSSLYYHFVEARRRTDNRQDDFSVWLAGFGETTLPFTNALAGVDAYFVSLDELRRQLIEVVGRVVGEPIRE